MGTRPLLLGAGLALKDLRCEWLMLCCHGAALAAILIPLLVLDGLRTGIVAGLTDALRSDPAKLRLNLPGTLQLDTTTVEAIGRLPGVGFLMPAQRAIASRILLKGSDGDTAQVDLLPSGHDDPLLSRGIEPPDMHEMVISADLAERLGWRPGARLTGHAVRHGGDSARFDHEIRVTAILPADWLKGRQALVAAGLIDWLEAFRDNYGLPEKGIAGDDPTRRPVLYENLRLYAESIEQVPMLATRLRNDFGLTVRAAEREIEDIRALEASLATVFWLIGGFALLGLLLSTASSLWADVERKRWVLGVLSLLGSARWTRLAFPLTHALVVASAGFAAALLAFLVIAASINDRFADTVKFDGAVCAIAADRLAWSWLLIMATAVAASLLAGIKVSLLSPTDGMREP